MLAVSGAELPHSKGNASKEVVVAPLPLAGCLTILSKNNFQATSCHNVFFYGFVWFVLLSSAGGKLHTFEPVSPQSRK